MDFRKHTKLYIAALIALNLQAPAVFAQTTPPLLDSIAQKRDAKQWLDALQLINQGLAKSPDDATLYRLQALTLADHGNLYRAWQMYAAHPDRFSPAERERLESGKHARQIVWSRVPGKDRASDLDEANAARAETDAYLARTDLTPETRRRVRQDRLLLLDRQRRFPELISEYEALRAEDPKLSAYVLPAVGNAYIAMKRPDLAEAIYREALALDPNNGELQIQHAYALVEDERFKPATDALWRLRESQPAWQNQPGSRIYSENWLHHEADAAYYMVRSYGEDLKIADEAYSGMSSIGPSNGGVQEATGSVYMRRGWDERALERFRMAETLDERDHQSRIGQVDALMNLQRYDLARPIHDSLLTQMAGNAHVGMMEERYRANRGWQIEGYYGGGRNHPQSASATSPLGSRDGSFGVRVASPLMDDRWRIVAGNEHRWADYSYGREADRRVFVGARYAFARLWSQLSASRASDGMGGVGLTWDNTWRFSDTFDGHFGAARHDAHTSLQARAAGVTADSAMLGITWSPSDLGQITASWQHWRFSDGNQRNILQTAGARRLLTRPHFLLDGKVGLYASRNTLANAAYFNPSSDRSVSLGFRANHLAWRHYERTFRHVLEVDAASYTQSGFGSAWIPSVSYRHEWKPISRLTISYGLHWSRPVYDGQRETQKGFDLSIRWGQQ